MIYTGNETLSRAGIGKYWKFHLADGSVCQGILSSLSVCQITYIPSEGDAVSLDWTQIRFLESVPQPSAAPCQTPAQWWNSKKSLVNDTYLLEMFSPVVQYRALFDRLRSLHTTPLLGDILSLTKRSSFRAFYFTSPTQMTDCLNELDGLLRQCSATLEETLAARSLIYLIGRDYIFGLKELLSRIVPNPDSMSSLMLPLACFYHEMSDEAGRFYWLSRYFTLDRTKIREDSPLWWCYLKCASVFDYMPRVWAQIEGLYPTDPALALQSAAFLFFLQGNPHRGSLLYRESLSPSPLSSELLHTFYSALSGHSVLEDWGSYFYRYSLRADRILREGTFRSYDGDQELSGDVYDYSETGGEFKIKVLGLDLISYSMTVNLFSGHTDPALDAICQKLRSEINFRNDVGEEHPIRVCFSRDRTAGYAKRPYSILLVRLEP